MDSVRETLERVQRGELSVDEAFSALKWAPYEDLGFAPADQPLTSPGTLPTT